MQQEEKNEKEIHGCPTVAFFAIAYISFAVWLGTLSPYFYNVKDYHEIAVGPGIWPPIIVLLSMFIKIFFILAYGFYVPKDPDYVCYKHIPYDIVPKNCCGLRSRFKGIAQGVVAFLYAWIFICLVIDRSSTRCFVGLLSFLIEGFCAGELLKIWRPIFPVVFTGCSARSVDFGLFKYVATITVCITQNVFGFWSTYSWIIFVFSLVLLSLHNFIPRLFYYTIDNETDVALANALHSPTQPNSYCQL